MMLITYFCCCIFKSSVSFLDIRVFDERMLKTDSGCGSSGNSSSLSLFLVPNAIFLLSNKFPDEKCGNKFCKRNASKKKRNGGEARENRC